MDYQQAVSYLEGLMPTQLSPGLERLAAFLAEHDNPQDKAFNIHIAGTNGKGSVVALVEECLRRAGIHTGRYTGPHLLNWTERIQNNGHEITEEDFAALATSLKSLSETFAMANPERGSLTWFELITAMAFFYFQKNDVHTAVIEVGLGGRWDATNTINSATVSTIVSVGLDHMQILGDTIGAIAKEKAEIIKENVPVVTACDGEALEIIKKVASSRNAAVLSIRSSADDGALVVKAATGSADECKLASAVQQRIEQLGLNKYQFKFGYQQLNARVASSVLAVYELKTGIPCLDKFNESIENYFWPGRLQYFPEHDLILDGAHNEDGARALRASLDELFPNKHIDFILSFYRTKQFEPILSAFLRPGDRVWASQADGRRAVVSTQEIAAVCKALAVPIFCSSSLKDALEGALRASPDGRLRVATGSFATVAAALNVMGYRSVEASRSATKPLFVPAQA